MTKMAEWEVTSYCSFNCYYCSLPSISTNLNEEDITKFISINLKNDILSGVPYIFLFGGEPFLHPKIDFVLNTLNNNKVPFIIQTHLSDITTKNIIQNKDKEFILHLSVHLTEQTMDNFLKNLVSIKDFIKINKIDVMYSITQCERLYLKLLSEMRKLKIKIPCHLTPIADFHNVSPLANSLLKEYNLLKINRLKSMLTFETTNLFDKDRSILWEEQLTNKYTTIGKECMYKNHYKLYNSSLEEFSCHRQKNVTICEDQCFLM